MAAKDLLNQMTTKRLCELFEMTETMNSEEIPTVRGWIMDEIESRNPAGFDKWLDESAEDKELCKYVMEA